MRALLQIWLDICLLRATPQQVPASPYLLALAFGLYLLMDMLVALPGASWPTALALTLVDSAVLVLLTLLLLQVTGKRARLNQTLSAMAGTGALLGLLAVPLVITVQQQPTPPMAALLWLGLLFWNLAVRAHILRHALAAPFGVGLALSALYALVVLSLIKLWFPAQG